MKLADIIETYISGDWGNETANEDTPNAVNCVRGAAIVPITNIEHSDIPSRFNSDRALMNNTLQA